MSEKKQPCSDNKESKSDTDDIREESQSESFENGLCTEGQGSDSSSEESETITPSNNTEPCSDNKESKSDTDDIREESQSEPFEIIVLRSEEQWPDLRSEESETITPSNNTEPCSDKKGSKSVTDDIREESLPESSENITCIGEQEPDSGSEESETVTPSIKTEQKEEKTDNKEPKTAYWFQIFVGMAQIIAAIATVVYVVLVWQTLIEMQTQRNNAYNPEIVITPNHFKGGKADAKKHDIDNNLMYIDLLNPRPLGCYSWEQENETDIYFEQPYLTLKNIGQGTAKDVSVTFDNVWISDAVLFLNDMEYCYDNCEYMCDDSYLKEDNYINVSYRDSNMGEWFPVVEDYGEARNITYIAPGDDTVNVSLPESYHKLLAIIYYQRFYNAARSTLTSDLDSWQIFGPIYPNIIVTIHYYDMQGNEFSHEEKIPFYCNAQLKEAATIEEQLESLEIRMGIYNEYLR